MSDLNRRGFLGAIGTVPLAAYVTLRADVGEVQALVEPSGIECLDTPSGQSIYDVIVGAADVPMDMQYVIEFYKEKTPSVAELQVPLNYRATFRWVATPGGEIKLAPCERLLWRVAYMEDAYHPTQPRHPRVCVHTRGACLRSGRQIVNQTHFS